MLFRLIIVLGLCLCFGDESVFAQQRGNKSPQNFNANRSKTMQRGRAGGHSTAGSAMKRPSSSMNRKPGHSPSMGRAPNRPQRPANMQAPKRPSYSNARPATRPNTRPSNTRPGNTRPNTRPGSSFPGGAKPGYQRPSKQPGMTRPSTRPSNKWPQTKPGSMKPGTRPQPQHPGSMGRPNKPGTRPAIRPPTRPGVKPETRPNTRPSINPGVRPGTKPGTKPGVRPGTRPETKPGVRPGTKPGTRPPVRPGTKPGVRPGTKPGTRPPVRPGTKPETKPNYPRPNRPGGGGSNRPIRPGGGSGFNPGGGGGGGFGGGSGFNPGGIGGNRPNWNNNNNNQWGNNWGNNWNNQWNNQWNNNNNFFGGNQIQNNINNIQNNWNINANTNYFNRGAWDRWNTNWGYQNHWYTNNYRPWHNSWYHGSWNYHYGNSAAAFGIGTAVGAATSWLWGPSIYQSGYYTYANPYCSSPTVIEMQSGPQVVVDYTQPIPSEPIVINNNISSSDAGTDAQTERNQPLEPDQTGLETYEEARSLFYRGDYENALAKSNLALSKLPTDATLHQFRALCLFALKDYRSAAAAINSVLSVGPGWDWTTLSSLYPSTETYETQLRNLESFVSQNPKAAFAHFLLAYQYITCGYNDEAVAELRETVALEPSDTVASSLLNMLAPEASDEAEDDDQKQPIDIDAESLFGSWQAQSGNDGSIDLALDSEGKFRWVVTQNQKPGAELTGEYSLADDKLMLQPEQGGPLVGVITPGDGQFQFRIAGAPPGDKGLNFEKK